MLKNNNFFKLKLTPIFLKIFKSEMKKLDYARKIGFEIKMKQENKP
jgi:hypothetical protein